ncbi:MAG: hypothetical protein KKG59_00565, partial [Nanoarchaeota archaeon]|nr:hypothetical protein [Nanoarchaeota archaeon]
VAIVAILAMSIAIPNNPQNRWAATVVPTYDPDPYLERSTIPDPNTDSVRSAMGSASQNTVGRAGAALRDYYVHTTQGQILMSKVPQVIGEGCMGACGPNSQICEPCGCNSCPAPDGYGPCVCGSDEEEWGGSPVTFKLPPGWIYSEDSGFQIPDRDPGE